MVLRSVNGTAYNKKIPGVILWENGIVLFSKFFFLQDKAHESSGRGTFAKYETFLVPFSMLPSCLLHSSPYTQSKIKRFNTATGSEWVLLLQYLPHPEQAVMSAFTSHILLAHLNVTVLACVLIPCC